MSMTTPGQTSIQQAIEHRADTDEAPSYGLHVLLPVALVVVSLLIAAASILLLVDTTPTSVEELDRLVTDRLLYALAALIALSTLAAMVLVFVGLYKVIERRNQHFARDRILRQGVLDYARSLAEHAGNDRAEEHLDTMQRVHNESLIEETERPAAVHIIVQLLFDLWIFYLLWFLLKDVPGHSRRQARFIRETRELIQETGHDPSPIPKLDPLPERSYWAGAAMTLFLPVAGWMIAMYWVFQDPPNHFHAQWAHEDALLDFVEEHAPTQAQPAAEDTPSAGPDEADKSPSGEDDGKEQGEASFTVWTCGECQTRYKVPPKRPVRVTCKNCGNKEILRGSDA